MAIVLALGSAVTYGFADFIGGRVASRAPALTVTVGSQLVGLLVVLGVVVLLPGELTGEALWLGAAAGMAGGTGLVVYFRALAIGPMGVVAPLTGAISASVPVLWGLTAGERVGPIAIVGIVLGLLAVVLSSIDPEVGPPAGVPQPAELVRRAVARARNGATAVESTGGPSGPLLGVVSGLAFGIFFVLLDLAPDDAGMWPLVGARLASVPVLGAIAVARRRPPPTRDDLPATALSGVLDITANALFLLATTRGLLVLVGLLVSLYPVVIVLLARRVLGERLERIQVVGCLLALAAVVLVSLG